MIELLAQSPIERARAIRDTPATPELTYAVRRVLFTDHDGNVRAAAARRLARLIGDAPVVADGLQWLLDALAVEPLPAVRDAIVRGLADCPPSPPALRSLAAIAAGDPTWWLRRTAIYALAACAPRASETIECCRCALADPFWRVRHAAVTVLGQLAADSPELRQALASLDADSPAVSYLRSSVGPAAIVPPSPALPTSELPIHLRDPDPAVVHARLLRDPAPPPGALVELLADPHQALRELAAERLARSGDLAALARALDWLDEPRIPHAATTVRELLDQLGDPALAVARHALARRHRPGAARWAIEWVVATRSETLFAAAIDCACEVSELRDAAAPLVDDDELASWLSDPAICEAAAYELHARGLVGPLAAAITSDSPRVRALAIDAAARCNGWHAVAAARHDEHHAPRAIAVRWLVKHGRLDPATAIHDRDPSVREACLASGDLACATDLLAHDRDPWVRRAAARVVATHRDVSPTLAATMISDRDPMVRMYAQLAAPTRGGLLDDAAMVRAAAADRLACDVVAPLLGAVTAVADRDDSPPPLASPPAAPTAIARRYFGRAGFAIAPLAISGVYDVAGDELSYAHHSGVDLFFWEPGYDRLGRWLRERPRDTRVLTGSYHGDAKWIRRDVESALRTLRRERLDGFLLFWVRSPARVDGAAFAMLDRLKREGKLAAIGFSTHHRELAADALRASPWDVVMVRHSAAHPGAEHELFPLARERGTAVVTFSALTYGRLLRGADPPSAAECYQYCLAQPAVTATVSAPRTGDELVANLTVLTAPPLSDLRIAELRAHGRSVRLESQRFNSLLRQPTRDAAAAARELLAGDTPPREPAVPAARRRRPLARLGRR